MLSKCPYCRGEIDVSDVEATATVHCTSCQREVSVDELLVDAVEDVPELDVPSTDGTGVPDAADSIHDGDEAAGDKVAGDEELDLDDLDDLEDFDFEGDEELVSDASHSRNPDKDVDDDVDLWLTEDTKDDTELEAEDTLVDSEEGLPAIEDESEFGTEPRPPSGDTHGEGRNEANESNNEHDDETTERPPGIEFNDLATPDVVEFAPTEDEVVVAAPIAGPVTEPTDDDSTSTAESAEQEPDSRQTIGAAPLVPKRRSLIGSLMRIGVALVVLLPLLQGVAWWALGLDPLGLANKLPGFLSPSSLHSRQLALPPVRPAPTRVPPASAEDDESTVEPDNEENDGPVTTSETEDDAIPPTADVPTASPDDGPTSLAENNLDSGPATGLDGGSPDGDSPPDGSTSEKPVTSDDSLGDLLEERRPESGALATGSDEDLGDLFGAAPPPVVEETSVFEGGKPRNAGVYSPIDIASTISKARKAHEAFDQGKLLESPDIKRLGREFYVAYCDLAQNSTYAGRDGSDEVLAESRTLLAEFSRDPKKQGLIARCAMAWLGDRQKAKRPTDRRGVLLAGTIKSIQKTGNLFELKVELATDQRDVVTIVTPMDPSDNHITELAVDDQVVVMGVEVEQPSGQLPGYEGDQPSVIYVTDQIVSMH